MLTRCALAFFLVTSAAAAQTERARVFGLVRRANNQPVAGATVCLLSRPVPADERIGAADRLKVQTDATGKFRAQVLRGRVYTAYATFDQGRSITEPVEDVFPNVPVILRERQNARRVTLHLSETARWRDQQPWECRVALATRNVEVHQIHFGKKQEVVLPLLPLPHATLEIRGKDGLPLLQHTFDDAKPRVEITMPKRKNMRFGIFDAKTEKPVAGAKIFQSLRGRLAPIGSTNANGLLQRDIALDRAGNNWPPVRGFAVLQPDYSPGRCIEKQDDPRREIKVFAKFPDHICGLRPGTSKSGRLLLRPGTPAKGVALLIHGSAQHLFKNGGHYDHYDQVVWTNAGGSYEVPAPDKSDLPFVNAVLSAEHIAMLPKDWHVGLSPFVPVLPEPSADGVHILRDLRPVSLTFRTHDGLPASHAQVRFYPRNGRNISRKALTCYTDRRGNLRILLPQDTALACYAVVHGSVTLGDLRVDSAPSARREIRMIRSWRIRGKVKGKVARTGVTWDASPYGSKAPRHQTVPNNLCGKGLTQIEDARWVTRFLNEVSFYGTERAHLAEDGTFQFDLLPIPMAYQLKHRRRRHEVVLRQGDVLGIELK